jgi:hypothetical protein
MSSNQTNKQKGIPRPSPKRRLIERLQKAHVPQANLLRPCRFWREIRGTKRLFFFLEQTKLGEKDKDSKNEK